MIDMIITVIGGGPIGTALVGYMSHVNRDDQIRLCTSRPGVFSRGVIVSDWERNTSYETDISLITDNYADAVSNADIIFITHPHFMTEETLKAIRPFVKEGAAVGIIPGSGGGEFAWKKYYTEKNTLFGFQRVPFTAKYKEYGKETNLKSWKAYVVVATIPSNRNNMICEMIEKHCFIKCKQSPNYLCVTLTPSNPVLHTSRTYNIFKNTTKETVFTKRGMYYKDWTDETSKTMLAIDKELHQLMSKLKGFDFSSVKPLTVHYESFTVEEMTSKISSIPTFQTVPDPMVQVEHGWVADIHSRLFTEDFPYGLCIIKGFCELCNVDTPTIDKVLHWYENFIGLEYYKNDGSFTGKDLEKTGAANLREFKNVNDIYAFYNP